MVSFTIHYLISNVWYRDVFVDFDGGFVVPEQVENVCDCRGDPSSPLIEEFVEPVRKKKVKNMFFLFCNSFVQAFSYLKEFKLSVSK